MIYAKQLWLAIIATSVLGACNRASQPAEAPAAPVVEGPPSSSPAARPSAYSQAYETCMASGDAAKGVTYAMQMCIIEELKVEDERLNTAYQRVMASLDEAGSEQLRQAQRAWIVVRDSTCQANLTGGTIDRLNIPSCRLDATVARTKELQAMATAG